MSTPRERYLQLEEDIQFFRQRRGIAHPITLVTVSKGVPFELIEQVNKAGCFDFGESRIPEALEKKARLDPSIRWHMMGNIQTKKISKLIGQFALVESVDSLELLKGIDEKSREAGVITSVLLQANTSGEKSKHGLTPEEWERVWDDCKPLSGVLIEGFMTMAPLGLETEVIRHCFKSLRLLRDKLLLRAFPHTPLYHLSMGMSQDWRIAVEEGATIVRIGSAIFK